MKLTTLLLIVALTSGCKHFQTIKIDSEPPGAHVFVGSGADVLVARKGRNYLGTTPCEWTTQVESDGTFIKHGIAFYSKFHAAVYVFAADPPSGQTNLFSKEQHFHCNAYGQDGDQVPTGIFFDLTKPPEQEAAGLKEIHQPKK